MKAKREVPNNMSLLELAVVSALLLFKTSTAATSGSNSSVLDIAERLGATQFVSYVKEVGLDVNLTNDGPFTVFVPSNEAFSNLPNDTKDNFQDIEYVRTILRYHIVNGRHYKHEFKNEMKLISLDHHLKVRINFYHGQVITVSGSPISSFDNEAENGVVHVTERVIYITPEFGTVAETLAFMPILNYMKYGMWDGNMTHVLQAEGPVTLFAPSDVAFQQLPQEEFRKLYKNQTAIKRMMRNHIVRGTFFTSGLYKDELLVTLEGQTLNVSSVQGNVTIEDAQTLIPDWTCSNGVMHITSAVFMPPGLLASLADVSDDNGNETNPLL